MGIRETLNQKKGLASVLGAGLIVVAGAVMIWASSNSAPGPLKHSYFSDDDGKTYFSDDSNKLCPFDHDGKQAVRAFVFSTGGQPFVAYLQKYSDDAKSKLEAFRAKPAGTDASDSISELMQSGVQVKRPGEKNWVAANSLAGQRVAVISPPGGGIPHELVP